MPQIVFPRQTIALWILSTSLIFQHHQGNEWNRGLWLLWEPIVFIWHIWAPILDTLYSKWKFWRCSICKWPTCWNNSNTGLAFWELLILSIREVAVFFLASFTSPGTDSKGSILLWVRIWVRHHIYLLGMNWSVKVKEKAILFLQRCLSLLEIILDFFFFNVPEFLVSSATNLACGTFYPPR